MWELLKHRHRRAAASWAVSGYSGYEEFHDHVDVVSFIRDKT